jgi:hypothetical protein
MLTGARIKMRALCCSGSPVAVAGRVIPSPADQDRCAQLRRPMDMIVHGWSTRRFQAKQQ